MDAKSFLAAILPSQGYYVVAHYNQKHPERNEEHVVTTIDEAVAKAFDLDARGKDAFYGLGSLENYSVQIQKLNKQTGQFYTATAHRVKQNIKYINVIFVEIDVEPSGIKKNKPCYSSQDEAIKDLKRFCKESKLPRPSIVLSGGGVHVYWRIDGDTSPADQLQLTTKLRALIAADMPKVADVGVITDTARVLRVPETHNYKEAIPRPVLCLSIGVTTNYDTLSDILDNRLNELGVTTTKKKNAALPDYMQGVENVLQIKFDDIPPLRFEKVLKTCQQIRWAYDNQNNVSEPMWMNCIRVLQKCDDHVAVIHDFSKQYKNYSESETDAKIAHVTSNYPTPVGCDQFENERPGECLGCPHAGKGSSPAWLSRDVAVAAPATVEVALNVGGSEVIQTVTIPDPPFPYVRTKDGKIVRMIQDKNGNDDEVEVSAYDMYPTSRRTQKEGEEHSVWRFHRGTHDGWVDVEIPAHIVAERQGLYKLLFNHGIYLDAFKMEAVQLFMTAYLRHIQTQAKAEQAYKVNGWHPDNKFLLGDRLIDTTGAISLLNTKSPLPAVCKAGTLENWIAAMEFYNHPKMVQHQFVMTSFFASVLMRFANQNGVLINLDGVSGSGKTTVCLAGMSIYGNPALGKNPVDGNKGLSVSGNRGSFTESRLYELLGIHNSLPFYMDEITELERTQLGYLVHSISQGVGRERMKHWNANTSLDETATWRNISISTSNGTVFQKLNDNRADSQGQTNRIFELYMAPNHVRTKSEADKFIRTINSNYGHAIEPFMQYVMTHLDEVRALVEKSVEMVDKRTNENVPERYRTTTVGLVGAAGLICEQIGLLPWKAADLVTWGVEQIKSLRVVTDDYIQSPEDVLSTFLEENNGNMLVLTGINGSKHLNAGTVHQSPRGSLLIRYEPDVGKLWLSRFAMQSHCNRIKADFKQIEEHLMRVGIVRDKNARKSLGANTLLDKTHSRCWELDMLHPALADKDIIQAQAVQLQRSVAVSV